MPHHRFVLNITDRRSLKQAEVIDLFLRTRGIQLDRVPDEENRETPDVDAVAEGHAIEHTSVESWKDQRRHADNFLRVLAPLELEVGPTLGCYLLVTVPYDVAPLGTNWDAITDGMRRWITEVAPTLDDCVYTGMRAAGVPFEFTVDKETETAPGLEFVRAIPGPPSIDADVGPLLSRKVAKLAPYSERGYRTILLVESSDLHLVSHSVLVAIGEAFGGLPLGVDEVWFIDTSLPEHPELIDFTDALIRGASGVG